MFLMGYFLMKMNRCVLFLIVSVYFMMGGVWAAGLPEPTVEYSADSTVQTGNYTSKSKVYRSIQKERREMKVGESQQIVISRMDKNLIWMLMPMQKIYTEMSMGKMKGKSAPGNMTYEDIQQTVVGEEMIQGIKTTKSKVTVIDVSGTTFQGHMWTTAEGITLKMETAAKGRGESFQTKMVLENLEIKKQDPNLFEIPDGYTKMDMGFPFGGQGLGQEP